MFAGSLLPSRNSVAGVIPRRWAAYYLENAPSLSWLVAGNAALVVLGARWYVGRGLDEVSTFLWPLFADSPMAAGLAALAFATLLANLGRSIADVPLNRPLAYLHTLAFAWLVKYGLWTAVALNRGFGVYFPDPLAYWGVLLSHLALVAEASLLPHAGATTRGALGVALVALLANDVVDYAFGYHPPLRYDPGTGLAVASVALSVGTVWAASRAFPRLRESR